MLERDNMLCVVVTLVVWLLVAVDTNKRAEMSPMPFVLGSRYGRAGGAGDAEGSGGAGVRLLAPRNDRYDPFFMGSRYGKRSESPGSLTSGAGGGWGGPRSAGGGLLCEFTGVYSLYRCVAPNKYNSRRIEELRMGEEE